MKPQCLGFVTKMIRSLLSRSHVIIPHSIQRQPTLEPAEFCFIVLFTVTPTCICRSYTHCAFFFSSNHSPGCRVQDGGAKRGWVKFEKLIKLSNEEGQRQRNVFCRGSRVIGNADNAGRQRWKEISFWTVISFVQFVRTAVDTVCCDVLQLLCSLIKNRTISVIFKTDTNKQTVVRRFCSQKAEFLHSIFFFQ